MKYCPECGSQLPNETIKFCPECGFKLSSQTKSDYNIVCPDCKTKIKDENSDCPNCGFPSSLFKEVQIPQKHTSELEQTNDQDVICPDCGLVMEKPIPAECPSCGCPADKFESREIVEIDQNIYTSSDEKVYYSDEKVHISNKIWSLGGWDEINTEMSGVMYIPVKSISCVDISRNRYWWIPLIIGALLILWGIIVMVDGEEMGILPGFIGGILVVIAFVVRGYRKLVIKPHNSLTQFSFHLSNPQEAVKYLKPMLQCLKENM